MKPNDWCVSELVKKWSHLRFKTLKNEYFLGRWTKKAKKKKIKKLQWSLLRWSGLKKKYKK